MEEVMLQLKLFQFVVLALILPSVVIGESLAFAALSDRETQLLKERELVYLAQEEDFKRPQSYEEILEAVMLRNAELEAAFYEWKAAVHGIRQARSFDDPELTFRTFLKEVHTRVGPQRQVYGIGQMLPF